MKREPPKTDKNHQMLVTMGSTNRISLRYLSAKFEEKKHVKTTSNSNTIANNADFLLTRVNPSINSVQSLCVTSPFMVC